MSTNAGLLKMETFAHASVTWQMQFLTFEHDGEFNIRMFCLLGSRHECDRRWRGIFLLRYSLLCSYTFLRMDS